MADMKRKGLAAMIATIMSTTLMMIVLMTMKAKDMGGGGLTAGAKVSAQWWLQSANLVNCSALQFACHPI